MMAAATLSIVSFRTWLFIPDSRSARLGHLRGEPLVDEDDVDFEGLARFGADLASAPGGCSLVPTQTGGQTDHDRAELVLLSDPAQ